MKRAIVTASIAALLAVAPLIAEDPSTDQYVASSAELSTPSSQSSLPREPRTTYTITRELSSFGIVSLSQDPERLDVSSPTCARRVTQEIFSGSVYAVSDLHRLLDCPAGPHVVAVVARSGLEVHSSEPMWDAEESIRSNTVGRVGFPENRYELIGTLTAFSPTDTTLNVRVDGYERRNMLKNYASYDFAIPLRAFEVAEFPLKDFFNTFFEPISLEIRNKDAIGVYANRELKYGSYTFDEKLRPQKETAPCGATASSELFPQ